MEEKLVITIQIVNALLLSVKQVTLTNQKIFYYQNILNAFNVSSFLRIRSAANI